MLGFSKRTLSFKLIFGGALLVIIPLVVVGLFAVNKTSKALIKQYQNQSIQMAHSLAEMTESTLRSEMTLARQLSVGNLVVRSASRVAQAGELMSADVIERANGYLAMSIKQIGENYESILITDLKGIVFSDSNEGAYHGQSFADQPSFKAAMNGDIAITDPYMSEKAGEAVAPVIAPVTDKGKTVGALVLVMKMAPIANKFDSVELGKTGYPFMINNEGLLIVHPVDKHELELNLNSLNGMESISKNMIAGQSGIEEYEFESLDKIAGYSPIPLTGWSVGITQVKSELLAGALEIQNIVMMVAAVFLLLSVFALFLFARSIARPIDNIVNQLNAGSDEVTDAAKQISSSSQQLAEGAATQAASIEETSSSLEEMSSMTRQNADNAGQADAVMQETKGIITKASSSMNQLTASMQEITHTSEETQKIVKTIDEIAFQTNLLALNAAVEAARAGEAGAGFAVVADEVRNLAIRAAEAARNTSDLIEGSVLKIKEGSELVETSNTAFNEVADSTSRVAELISEIAAASKEQALGIEQVNNAVSDMDKITQQNAAGSEESASAAEEMSAQSEMMKSIIGELVTIIEGASKRSPKALADTTSSKQPVKKVETGRVEQTSGGHQPANPAPATAEVAVEDIIPFADMEDEFKDF